MVHGDVNLATTLFFSLENYRCGMSGSGKGGKKWVIVGRSGLLYVGVRKGGMEWEEVKMSGKEFNEVKELM